MLSVIFTGFPLQNLIRFIAVVDCTGHGVPGAFMSMIGNQLLNEIVNEKKIFEPHKILTQLNLGVIKALNQDTTNNNDGMDICLCSVAPNSNLTHYKITFAGAKRPLYYFKTQEKKLIKQTGSRMSIGGRSKNSCINFTSKEIILQKNDLIYLTSDGYIDQNNKERKRFGTKHLENILNKITDRPLPEQKQVLEIELDKWQGTERQRDDITVIGIKI